MAEPVQLSFALSRIEYLIGARLGVGRIVRVGAVAGAGLIAGGTAAKLDVLTAMGIISLLAALVAWFLPWWRWTSEPSLHAEERWTIDDDGCTIDRTDSTSTNAWSYYRELVDAGRVYVLFGSRGTVDVIPKRVLESAAGAAAFADRVQAHVAVRETTTPNAGWTD